LRFLVGNRALRVGPIDLKKPSSQDGHCRNFAGMDRESAFPFRRHLRGDGKIWVADRLQTPDPAEARHKLRRCTGLRQSAPVLGTIAGLGARAYPGFLPVGLSDRFAPVLYSRPGNGIAGWGTAYDIGTDRGTDIGSGPTLAQTLLPTGLSLHMSVSEKPGQESVGLKAAANLTPIPKRLFRQIGKVERFPPGKAASAVIVRIVPGFLKLNEGGGDGHQWLLNLLMVQTGCEPRGNRTSGERNSDLLHRGVMKGTGETVP